MRAAMLGQFGEQLALAFYQAHGFHCRARRWRRGGGEIDLVVERADITVFVEVKARGPGSLGRAVEAVHARQLLRLRRLAGQFCAEEGAAEQRRLDVVTVDLLPESRGLVLRHFPDVG